MTLGLETVRLNGRASAVLPTVLSVRDLSSEEVLRASAREAETKPSPLQRISQRHHELARKIAAGVRPGVAAAEMGFTASRVSILMDDPLFKELVAIKGLLKDASHYGMGERLKGLGNEALDELIRRMEEEPEDFSPDELLAIARMSADRTGFGPAKSETRNVNVNFGDALDAARKRAEALPPPPPDSSLVEDVEYEEVS